MINKKSSPLVSIIIPLYNKEQFVRRTIESVLMQTFGDFEVVVVDDGSTDNGAKIVSCFEDQRIKLISQENAGPGAARNTGIRASCGQLLAFLDADDEWDRNFLELSIKNLHDHPDTVATIHGHYITEHRVSREQFYRDRGIAPGEWKMPVNITGKEAKTAIDFMHSGAVLCKREAIEQCGGFYEKNRSLFGEDAYLWLQIMLKYCIYRDPAPLMWYRTDASELGMDRSKIWPMLIDPESIREGCPVSHKSMLERILAYYAMLAARRKLRDGNVSEAKELLTRFRCRSRHEVWTYLKLRLDALLASYPRVYQWAHKQRE